MSSHPNNHNDNPSLLPDASAIGSELSVAGRKDVWDALAALPEGERAVLLLHEFYRLPDAEIARILDLPPETVAERVLKAQTNFREQFANSNDGAVASSIPPAPSSSSISRLRAMLATASSTISFAGSGGLAGLGPRVAGGIWAAAAGLTTRFAIAAVSGGLATVIVAVAIVQLISPGPHVSAPDTARVGTQR